MSTSKSYLVKRLHDIGRHDLLAAVAAGELSTYAAAEAAGLIKRPAVSGRGSQNQQKTRYWAVLRATGEAPPLPPKSKREPAMLPAPAQKFSQETRDIIARLVEA